MAWSTRELAERAGTTVNTIRHYHRLGLLDEPEREENGYKQYQVHHLVSLLRIRRLADLGVPLTQIGAVRADADGAPQLLRELDAELAENIRRMKKARSDIAALLRDDAPADTPVGFEPVAGRMSESDLSIVHIYTRLYDDAALADIRMIAEDTDGSPPISTRSRRTPPRTSAVPSWTDWLAAWPGASGSTRGSTTRHRIGPRAVRSPRRR